jgi:hypothetical protein
MTSPPIGQLTRRFKIVNITNALPCVVTTELPNEFPNKSFVRITDLNGAMPVPRGEDPLNNYRFRIIVTGATTFYLEDPITFVPIDSTTFPPYVEGGSCNLVVHDYIFYPSPDQAYPN